MTADTKLILNKMDEVREDLQGQINGLDKRVAGLDEKVAGLDERVGDLQRQVTGINLTLENNIYPAIRAVAEGHMDLHRKMDRVLEIHEEREMYLVRFNKMENDVRVLKENYARLA